MAPVERVLSIQSHVAYGYVGGKAAVFPLQCLGYDVDVVNSVHFSNHAGYGRSGGSKTSAAELNEVFLAMEDNELLLPTRLLTGYIPGAEALNTVANLARKLKNDNPRLIYLLDPVMGDAGRLYVSADVIPVYRDTLPLATIITPNWFEAGILTDIELNDLASLRRALRVLHHKYRIPNVVITSIPLTPWLLTALPSSLRPPNDPHLLCLSSSVSSRDASNAQHIHEPSIHIHCVPLIPGYFSGVGDLFSALLLAHFQPPPSLPSPPLNPAPIHTTPLSAAVSLALSKTHAILQLTYKNASVLPAAEREPTDDELDQQNPLRKPRRMRGRELALVQGQNIIRNPDVSELRRMQLWEGFWTDDQG